VRHNHRDLWTRGEVGKHRAELRAPRFPRRFGFDELGEGESFSRAQNSHMAFGCAGME